MINKFRYWLIRLLARGEVIILNTHFTSPCHLLFKSEIKGMIRYTCFEVKDGEEELSITNLSESQGHHALPRLSLDKTK